MYTGKQIQLVIQLNLRFLAIFTLQILGWFADIDMAYCRLFGQSGQILALWHSAFHLQGHLTHVGNNHEEEEYGEYQVWQR